MREPKGTIFQIERLALHDGPGIRTVVFFKGCPLRCQWCSSPESKTRKPEILYEQQRCTGCLECVAVCPQGALAAEDTGTLVLERNRCQACGLCVKACSSGARSVSGQVVSVEDVVLEIEKDAIFHHRSGGGVTLSGGEPLLQPEFAAALLKACRYRGLHTAMETCAYAQQSLLDSLCPYLDLIYMDLKHLDPDRHEALTGVRNEPIVENIRHVDACCEPTLILRVPLIPGCNDRREDIEQMAVFVSGLQRVQRVELLPYHRYGLRTYERLGRACPLAECSQPTEKHMHALGKLFQDKSIQVQIGG